MLTPARQTLSSSSERREAVWPGKIRSRAGCSDRAARRSSYLTTPAITAALLVKHSPTIALALASFVLIRGCAVPSNDFVLGLKCRVCGKLYPKAASIFCPDDFGPLEVAYDYDAHQAPRQSRQDRHAPEEHVAVPGTPPARRRTHRRPAGRRHPAHPRRPTRRRARCRTAVDQERRGQLPDAVVQRSRRLGRAVEGPRVRHENGRLRQHRQPREQRRRARRARRAGNGTSSSRPIWSASRSSAPRSTARRWSAVDRHLRRGEPTLHADRH